MDDQRSDEILELHKKMILQQRILEETSALLLKLEASQKFLHLLGYTITLSLGASHAAVLVYDEEKKTFRVGMSAGLKKIPASLVKLDSESELIRCFQEHRGNNPLQYSQEAKKDLERLHADLCLPIQFDGKFVGFLIIGARIDGKPHENGTISFFKTLTNYIGLQIKKEDFYRDSITDPLTGLYNRKHLDESLNNTLIQSNQTNGRIGLAMIDIDHFKEINDQHGHACGDLVIKKTAEKIRANVRQTDKCFRFGGEEFCILFQGLVKRDGTVVQSTTEEFQQTIQNVIKRLKTAVGENEVVYEGKTIKVTVSIGLTFLSSEKSGFFPEKLIRRADHLMYEAKKSGRNQIFMTDDVEEGSAERVI